jgi:NAD(P)H dehydrogenase (quinone)
MPHIVVVFHSGYGHTQRLAQAVAAGADAQLLAIDADGNLPEGGWALLKAADAIVFGSPTYMGSVSWQFKKFADDSSKPWYEQAWRDKLAAGFTSSSGLNGDKLATLDTLYHLAMQHSMIWVSQGLMPSSLKKSTRDDTNNLAAYSGAMSHTPADASPGEMSQGDLATARLFGERVALVASRFKTL